ncbi:hypothetical protein LTR70_009903 [Exophiala xenobiotica]|uniref:Uncharacterized protein n=1 Tax=Lithohypha guttulata TaxID=1690604 RepID=A0ABR0JWZ3_9EURO|nr:hypothetical protein LTR24_009743 [Lithohypha guttulata]KAK5309905.1 hypothetical protein LTR70_009903 [Exophiala xenobiotica]
METPVAPSSKIKDHLDMAQMKGWHHIPTQIQTKTLRLALFAESRGVTGIHTPRLSQDFTFDCPLDNPYVDSSVRRVLHGCSTLVDGPWRRYTGIDGVGQATKAPESEYRTLHKTFKSGNSAKELLAWAGRYLTAFTELHVQGTPLHELLTLVFRVTDQYHHALIIEGLPDLEGESLTKAIRIGRALMTWLFGSASQLLFMLPNTLAQQKKCMVAQMGGRSLFTWVRGSDEGWYWDYPHNPNGSSGAEGPWRTDITYCHMVEQEIKLDLAMARAATLRPPVLWHPAIRTTWRALKLRLGLPGSSNVDENTLQPDWHFFKPEAFLQEAKEALDVLAGYVANCQYATQFGDAEQPIKDWLAEVEETLARFEKAVKRRRRTTLPVLVKPFAIIDSGFTFPSDASWHADYRGRNAQLNKSSAAL